MDSLKRSTPEESLFLSIVIATYNGAEYIDRCLQSFTDQSISSRHYEVIVVNNDSTDQTEQIVNKYLQNYNYFFLVDEKRQGVSYARNSGILKSRGKYISFIDDDAYADRNWVRNILNAFRTNSPSPAVVGGRILPYYTTDKPAWFKDCFEVRDNGLYPRFLSRKECNVGFPESNYSVDKRVLDEVGAFSTDLGPVGDTMRFGEGMDLSKRISQSYPYFWYDPEIIVYHLVPKRNMSKRYILSRKYKSAYAYQSLRTPSESTSKNLFVFSICLFRIFLYSILSILSVRWWSKKATGDWLHHAIYVVKYTSRCIFIIKYLLHVNQDIDSVPSYVPEVGV